MWRCPAVIPGNAGTSEHEVRTCGGRQAGRASAGCRRQTGKCNRKSNQTNGKSNKKRGTSDYIRKPAACPRNVCSRRALPNGSPLILHSILSAHPGRNNVHVLSRIRRPGSVTLDFELRRTSACMPSDALRASRCPGHSE